VLSRARGVLNNPVGVLPAPDLHLFKRCYGKLLHDLFVLDDLHTGKESVRCARWECPHEHAGTGSMRKEDHFHWHSKHTCIRMKTHAYTHTTHIHTCHAHIILEAPGRVHTCTLTSLLISTGCAGFSASSAKKKKETYLVTLDDLASEPLQCPRLRAQSR
jgi:hypothetical protein